jgi:hypothetical protein
LPHGDGLLIRPNGPPPSLQGRMDDSDLQLGGTGGCADSLHIPSIPSFWYGIHSCVSTACAHCNRIIAGARTTQPASIEKAVRQAGPYVGWCQFTPLGPLGPSSLFVSSSSFSRLRLRVHSVSEPSSRGGVVWTGLRRSLSGPPRLLVVSRHLRPKRKKRQTPQSAGALGGAMLHAARTCRLLDPNAG